MIRAGPRTERHFTAAAAFFLKAAAALDESRRNLALERLQIRSVILSEAKDLGGRAAHIRADRTFRTGDYTFYGRYVEGTAIDDRQPLGSLYGNRFFTGFQPDPLLTS